MKDVRTSRISIWSATSLLLRHRYLALCIVLGTAMLLQTVYGEWLGDFWEHCAVVRELMANPESPGHPLFAVDAGHPFFSPYHLAVALLARLLSLDARTALALAGMVNLAILLAGFRLFANAFFPRRSDAVSFYGLLLILLAWGSEVWNWSGFIHFRALGYVLPYPSTLALGLTWGLLAWLSRSDWMLRATRCLVTGLLCALAAGVILLAHPSTAAFTLLGIGAVSLTQPSEHRIRAVLLGGAIVTGAFLVAVAWPYYSFLGLLAEADRDFHQDSLTLYRDVLVTWPALVLAPAAAIAWARPAPGDRIGAIVLLLLALVLLYGLGYLLGAYGFGRLISPIVMLLQLSAAAAAARIEVKGCRPVALLPAAAIALLVVGLAPTAGNSQALHKITAATRGQRTDYSSYLRVGEQVPPDAVMIADLRTSWELPSFAGKVVASLHPAHWVPDHYQRRNDLVRFFSPRTSTADRQALIDRYNARFVLLHVDRQPDPTAYLELGEVVLSAGPFLLIQTVTSG